MPYITMCQGPKCTANGAGLIIRDMEDLAFGCATVEASGCMGQCSKGPNGMYSEKSGAKGKVTNKLNKYSKLTDMLSEFIQGYAMDDLQSRVHRVKFAIRREENAEVRNNAIEETLGSVDESQKSLHPELVAQLLCLRARERLKGDPTGAFADLREALTLQPDWPWAFVTLAQVLDNLHMPRGALASMQRAIEIGSGVDKNSLSRGIVRLERKAADAKGPDPVPAGIEMDIAAIKDKSLGGKAAAADNGKDKEKKDKVKPEGKSAVKAKSGKGKAKATKAAKVEPGEPKETKPPAPAANEEVAPKEEGFLSPLEEPKKEVPKESPKETPKEEPPKEAKEGKEVKEVKDKDKEAKDKEKKKSGHKKKKKVKKEKAEAAEFQDWQLREREELNHDCLRLRFACKGKAPSKFESSIWHIDLAAHLGDDGEEIQRSYTPLSTAEDYKKGILELVIKVYPKGKMSSHLGRMKTGDSLAVSRPVPTVDPEDYKEGAIFVAGGSAVVVALQAIKAILPVCTGSFHLYLCNRTFPDVLLTEYYDDLLKTYPNFHMTNCLSQGKPDASVLGKERVQWHEGRINGELLKKAPENLKVLMSGPDPLCKMVGEVFLELGRQEDDILCLDTDLEDLLNPEGKNEGNPLLTARSARAFEEPAAPVVDLPRARIKASKPQVISIDKISSPLPPPQPGFFSYFFTLQTCGCKAEGTGLEDEQDDVVKQRA